MEKETLFICNHSYSRFSLSSNLRKSICPCKFVEISWKYISKGASQTFQLSLCPVQSRAAPPPVKKCWQQYRTDEVCQQKLVSPVFFITSVPITEWLIFLDTIFLHRNTLDLMKRASPASNWHFQLSRRRRLSENRADTHTNKLSKVK